MTLRQAYEGILIELNKTKAPNLLLSDFNYLMNNAITQYINKVYNQYDTAQQTTDSLRVLKATSILDATISSSYNDPALKALYGAIYEVSLPTDYYHLLNCICVYHLTKQYKCYKQGDYVQYAAKRLTSDSWGAILHNYYNKPLPQRPYYYFNNINSSKTIPTNPYIATPGTLGQGTDMNGTYSNSTQDGTNSTDVINLSRQIQDKDTLISLVDKQTAVRYGNSSSIRMEIRYGDDSTFVLQKVLIDYIKTPQYVELTQNQLDNTNDISQIMEFPDYVCREIINELVTLIMENTSDPRLQTHPSVNQSIASPAQQQTIKK